MTADRAKKNDARLIATVLNVPYTQALRYLNEGKYIVENGHVKRGPNYDR